MASLQGVPSSPEPPPLRNLAGLGQSPDGPLSPLPAEHLDLSTVVDQRNG